MSMMSLLDFIYMGGKGIYVWPAYGIALLVMLWIGIVPVLKRRKLEASIRFRARTRSGNPESGANSNSGDKNRK